MEQVRKTIIFEISTHTPRERCDVPYGNYVVREIDFYSHTS